MSGEPNANKKEVSQSEASYGSMVQAGRDLAAAVAKLPGYNPAAADLQPAALKAAMAILAGHNEAVAGALVEASRAIADRLALYEAEQTGLRTQFQQAKAAVASQPAREYFRSSAAAAPSTRASPASAIDGSRQQSFVARKNPDVFEGDSEPLIHACVFQPGSGKNLSCFLPASCAELPELDETSFRLFVVRPLAHATQNQTTMNPKTPSPSSFTINKLIAVIVLAVAAVVCVAILKKGSVAEAFRTPTAANMAAQSGSYAQLIIGTWHGRVETPTGWIESRDTYGPDGTENSVGTMSVNGKERAIWTSGKWEINGEYLKTTVTSSNATDIMPNGYSQTDKIIRIDANEFEIEQPALGLRIVSKRVK